MPRAWRRGKPPISGWVQEQTEIVEDSLRKIPNTERLAAGIASLASITDPEQPYTRRPFTEFFQKGRQWLQGEMEAAGLKVRLDAAGNLVGWQAGREALPPLMIGSHTDTVAGGGRFDLSLIHISEPTRLQV